MADENKQPENTQDESNQAAAEDPKMTTDEAAEENVGEREDNLVENVNEHDVLDETPQDVAEDVDDADTLDAADDAANEMDEVAVTPDYAPDDEADELPEPQNEFEAAVEDAMDMAADEAAEQKAQDEGAVEAWDEGVQDVMANMQDVADDDDPVDMTHDHSHSDTVTLPYFGTFDIAGGIYTVIFIALALLTVIEVLAAEAFPAEGGAMLTVQIAILMLAALAKSVLVVTYYMHLNTDNRIFRIVMGIPFLMVVILLIYLAQVPPTGY
jgi:caa(3)-type oxidase subunit IV